MLRTQNRIYICKLTDRDDEDIDFVPGDYIHQNMPVAVPEGMLDRPIQLATD